MRTEVENIGVVALVKSASELSIIDPLELMTFARMLDAAEAFAAAPLEATVSEVVAPELGPYWRSYMAVNRVVSCASFFGS